MPYNPNANWSARAAAAAQDHVYFVKIEGVTTHYSTRPVRGASVTTKALLNLPRAVGEKVSPVRARYTMTITDVELVDRDGEITDLVSTDDASPTVPTLLNRRVEIWAGYDDLQESEYAPISVGQVTDVSLKSDGSTYVLKLGDLKRYQFEELFSNAEAGGSRVGTTLVSAAAVGAYSISPVSVENIAGGDMLYLGPSSDGGYTGQELKVKVLSVVGSTVWLTAPLTKAFGAGDELRWATGLVRGNPYNVMYALWTGDFAAAGFPIDKARGELNGLGVAAADVDVTGIQKERDYFYGDEVWEFEEQRPSAGFRFLEDMIYRWLGFPYVTIAGKLSFHHWRPEYPDVAAAGLTQVLQADIRSWEWKRDHSLHLNSVLAGVDYDPETGEPAETVEVTDSTDETNTKETAVLDVPRTGFRAALRGERLADERARTQHRMFLAPPPSIILRCGMSKRAVEVGETVEVTHPLIPNTHAGTRGFTRRRLLVVERQEDPRAGEVTLLVLEPQFTRPSFIAPDAAPDYDVASAADKEYAYIAPDAGNFADGGLPYEID